MKPRLYNRNMELLAVLKNASRMSYTHTYNDLYTASFELPADDAQNALCEPRFIVEIFDGDNSVGKYRIVDEPEVEITARGAFIRYECEHVIAFLMDDVIDGFLELGSRAPDQIYSIGEVIPPLGPWSDMETKKVIEKLLDRQTIKRWQLGECVYQEYHTYTWENTTLLSALFFVHTVLKTKAHWTYNTSTYPWTINLVKQTYAPSCAIRRKRNMQAFKRARDSKDLCTRLYCRGNGEGANQVNISSVTTTGKNYIDADTISTYGVISTHFIDTTISDPYTLLSRGREVLEENKHPVYTYTAKAVDLAKMAYLDWDVMEEGKCVHVLDSDLNLNINALIVQVSKADIDGNPLDMDIVISNKGSDTSSSLEKLAQSASNLTRYSQGLDDKYMLSYSDNADNQHPALIRLFIPDNFERMNTLSLTWKLNSFRAYDPGSLSILDGGTASNVVITVDGNIVPGIPDPTGTTLAPYLSQDDYKKITKGWHEIVIKPNAITRIEANLYVHMYLSANSGSASS